MTSQQDDFQKRKREKKKKEKNTRHASRGNGNAWLVDMILKRILALLVGLRRPALQTAAAAAADDDAVVEVHGRQREVGAARSRRRGAFGKRAVVPIHSAPVAEIGRAHV